MYKDAMEANSPVVRENCWEWYTSVVKTRMHNFSGELIVFTRWHEEDLIGTLCRREPFVEFTDWAQLDTLPPDTWLYLNFEALKTRPPSPVDPREPGEALWEELHGAELLRGKRRLDPVRFECMYQGRPSVREGLLYGDNFLTYEELPRDIVRRANYTDTADTGRRLPLFALLCRRSGRGDLRYRCGLFARTDGDDRRTGGNDAPRVGYACGTDRE